jgi:phosphohistidine phosphatase SixA
MKRRRYIDWRSKRSITYWLDESEGNMLGAMKYGFLCWFALALASSAVVEQPVDSELIAKLRQGGFVLFIRHPQTNPDQADTDPLHLENIKAQRQLSEEGRKQAKALGEAFRSREIPVAKVVSSKFYRAQEASRLMEVGKVEASLDVSEGGLVVSPNENKRRAAALKKLLSTPPPEGKNLVIVSHKPNLQDAAGKELGDVGEAEVVAFQPSGKGKFTVVARVAPEAWSKWAKSR